MREREREREGKRNVMGEKQKMKTILNMEAILLTARELASILKKELSPDWFLQGHLQVVKVLSHPKINPCRLCSIS